MNFYPFSFDNNIKLLTLHKENGEIDHYAVQIVEI